LLAALYAFPTGALLGWVWYNTKPEYHGFDWFMPAVLTLPTSALIDLWFPRVLPVGYEGLIGLAVNATAIYSLAKFFSYLKSEP
jgi:hypothetical protein